MARADRFIRSGSRQKANPFRFSSSFLVFLSRVVSRHARAGKEYGCAIRFPFTGDISKELETTYKHVPILISEFNPRRPDRFVVDFYDERATYEELLNIISSLSEGTTEVMCHPGYTDTAFANESVYNKQRDRELDILTDPSIQEAIQVNGIELITFAEI